MNILRKILHHKSDKSDKVYIIDVNKITGHTHPYIVTATWGKTEAPRLSSQIKGEYTNERNAVDLAIKLVNDKRNKIQGYTDAPAKLVIPGLVPLKMANISHVHASNKIPVQSSSVIDLVDTKVRRNIKV